MQALGYIRISPRPAFECCECGYRVTYSQEYCPNCKEITQWKRVKAETSKDYSGTSLAGQIESIRSYCAYKKIDLVGVYGDPLISGKSIENRPGLRTLLEIADRGQIGAVIVHRLDRFARNTVETLQTVERLEKKNVTFVSVTEELNTKTVNGRTMLGIIAVLAQAEREMISERTKFAMELRRQQGRRISRRAPYGFKFAGGKVLVHNEKEFEIYKRLQELEDGSVPVSMWPRILVSEGYHSKSGKEYGRSDIWRLRKAMSKLIEKQEVA